MGTTAATTPVPPFLELAAHPVRWQLLGLLADRDCQVGELSHALGEPQNLVSYHLGKLRRAGLVSSHRSSFDGRATYYRVHLDRCGDLLASAGAALHPGLAARAPVARDRSPRRGRPVRVLFACTGNGTRSQIAEALLRHRAPEVDVSSAGSHPKAVHPEAVAVLAERGIDISGATSTSLDVYAGHRFDLVVTLCDRVREVCPPLAAKEDTLHWSIEDPGLRRGTARATRVAFRAVADDLDVRIGFLLARVRSIENKEHHRHD